MSGKKIIIISGPTASGKSNLALNLASLQDISIINADSLQIYEGLPILSSQPVAHEKKLVKHFLYSALQPSETSSVGLWLRLLKPVVEQVLLEKKLPVIVGGSGMYISKLVEGISEIPEISDDAKNEARRLYEELGHEEFKARVGEEKITDKQRLIRGYEVLLQTGKPLSFWQNQPVKKIFEGANFLHININPDREELYRNCNLRFEKMLELGALEEVRNLLDQGAKDCDQITKTLGFSEIKSLLANEISREEMIKIATQKTRNYAKRQLTWFRHQLPEKCVFTSAELALEFLKSYEV